MTPGQLRFWRKVNAKAATLQPDMARAYFAGIEALRERLSARTLEKYYATQAVEQYIAEALSDANLSAAFSKYRAQVQLVTRDAVKWHGKEIPGVAAFVRGGGGGIAFDVLSPHVVTAIRALDTRVMTRLKGDVRETVRAIIENGLRDGAGPRQTSIAIREMIGLGKSQVGFVDNLRTQLETGKYADASRRALIDRRFNLAKLDAMAPAERAARIDKIVESYRKSFIATNAAATTRTATMDAFKQGQRLSWEQAAEMGIVDRDRLKKEWIGVGDDRERETHLAMNGTVVPFDEPYILPDGLMQMEPGEGEYNCRCSSRVFVERGN